MAASFLINSYLIRVFDFLIINLVGLSTFFAIQFFKDPELDLQRYAALMLLASLAYLFLTNRAYRSWRGGNLMALFGQVASGVLKTWILILIWFGRLLLHWETAIGWWSWVGKGMWKSWWSSG